MRNFTAYIQKDIESGMYIGTVPSLNGTHTYAETIDELQVRLSEVIQLCLEEMDTEEINALPVFAGITQVGAVLAPPNAREIGLSVEEYKKLELFI